MQEEHVVEKIKKSYKFVDLIFGTHNIFKLAELLYERLSGQKSVIDIWQGTTEIVEDLPSERKYSFKKKNFSSIVSCDRTDPSIYHNADTGSRENALPDAHTGVIMWIYLRRAIWFTYWDHYTSFKRCVVRNAGNFSECLLYGV